jgi:alpha-glucosidase (family GH31 glycosyl hydrolase)
MIGRKMTRRKALQSVAATGVGIALGPGIGLPQETPIQVAGRPVEIALTSVSPQTVRITVQPVENGQPQPIPSDGALVNANWGPPAARLRSLTGPRAVKCGALTVRLSANPLTLRVEARGGRMVQELTSDAATGKLSFRIGDAPVLGLGPGGPQFDRRGKLDRMGSGQGGYQLRTHGGKVPIQFLIGTGGWAMYIHQPLGSFDLTGDATHTLTSTPGQFQPANPQAALPMDVFVIGAKDPAAVMGEYARITGFPEMVPLWSFGYQQSHRTLGPPEEIVQEARMFREKKLPCDMMIYLGTDFCPNGWNTHNGEFTWNAKAFPDPKRSIDQLHQEHFKVVLHTVIEGRRITGAVADACTAPPIPSGRRPDNSWPADRQVSCYWPVHKPLLDLGVDGWWPDQGDGYDSVSRLARIRMYFEGHQMYRPNERVFALHRNGYAGMQRYAAFLWSGDVQSTWETLKTHIPVGVNAGLSGIPFWGTDIGGFVPTPDFTGELYVRWFQFSALCPLFRSHGRNWRLRLPWGWNTGDFGFQETPGYQPDPKELHNAAIEPICKKYLELRYQMMPYLYSAVKEACETGVPIIRSLWFHDPEDAAAVARGDQYLYGRDMLVAPVFERGATVRSLYLPRGTWYDFWTREKLEGGREIARKVDLETTPLYVRAGAVIPMGPVKQYTGERVDGPLTLWVHPGADGAFVLYEDDGESFNYRKGEFMKANIAWNDRQRRLSIRLAAGSKMLAPEKRNIVVRVAGETATREIVFEGRPVDVKV